MDEVTSWAHKLWTIAYAFRSLVLTTTCYLQIVLAPTSSNFVSINKAIFGWRENNFSKNLFS